VRRLDRAPLHLTVGSLCAGLASANALRLTGPLPPLLVILLVIAAAASGSSTRLALVCIAACLAGIGWGSLRLEAIDRSPLRVDIGRAGRMLVELTATPRRGGFSIRAQARTLRFEGRAIREPVLLELPLGRAPPQGARLEVLAEIKAPRPAEHGFDEARYLRRHGMHVVLRVDRWRVVGRRGGIGGVADRLHAGLTAALASGTTGERRHLLVGIVLGDDSEVPEALRDRFRSSGLYHLLAVSGQNVALVAAGVLGAAWLLGLSRFVAELGALAAIGAYVLAVGAQPSVVRAGVAGALGSLAWLTARGRDRWYFVLLGAFVLLAWNPYDILDAGFQLSFAAVGAIFILAPRIHRMLEGYPLPGAARGVTAVSAACGVTTAPILCLQFGSVPLYTVPANVLAEPAMPPLLLFSFVAAMLHPVSAGAAAAPAWLAGWCASYIAACARLVGGLPYAQVRTPVALAILAAGGAAYACWRWRPS
jgi:competence protein ComEC